MKNFLRRTLTAFMVTVLIVTQGSAVEVSAATKRYARVITNPSDVDAREYTDSAYLGEKLMQAAEGDMPLYRDYALNRQVPTALGTSYLKDSSKYGGGYRYITGRTDYKWSGESCFIYAVCAYYHFFDDLVTKDCEGMEDLDLPGNRKLTYENLKRWGVRDTLGAYVRLGQHSFIILKYDEETITYLDANGNGKGLIAIRTYSWNYFPWHMKLNISSIYQPTDEKYETYFVDSTDVSLISLEEGDIEVSGTVVNNTYELLPVKMVFSGALDYEIELGELPQGVTDMAELLNSVWNIKTIKSAISRKCPKGGECTVTISCSMENGREFVICSGCYEITSMLDEITQPIKD